MKSEEYQKCYFCKSDQVYYEEYDAMLGKSARMRCKECGAGHAIKMRAMA